MLCFTLFCSVQITLILLLYVQLGNQLYHTLITQHTLKTQRYFYNNSFNLKKFLALTELLGIDRFKCRRCVNNIQVHPPPEGTDCSANLSQWHHCADRKGLEDTLLKGAWDSGVSFVFHENSHDKQLGV